MIALSSGSTACNASAADRSPKFQRQNSTDDEAVTPSDRGPHRRLLTGVGGWSRIISRMGNVTGTFWSFVVIKIFTSEQFLGVIDCLNTRDWLGAINRVSAGCNIWGFVMRTDRTFAVRILVAGIDPTRTFFTRSANVSSPDHSVKKRLISSNNRAAAGSCLRKR
jgi:hypothetical protein